MYYVGVSMKNDELVQKYILKRNNDLVYIKLKYSNKNTLRYVNKV